MAEATSKKQNQLTPKKIRGAIIGQVQRFQELSRKVKFTIPPTANLKTIINNSTSIKKIRIITNEIAGKWGKEDLDMERWIRLTKKLKISYEWFIDKTGFITDETDKENLKMIPLALEDIIKEYDGD